MSFWAKRRNCSFDVRYHRFFDLRPQKDNIEMLKDAGRQSIAGRRISFGQGQI